MKKLTMLAVAAVIATTSFACCRCGKCPCSTTTVAVNCTTTNCVCTCHSGQACSVEGCVCDCHDGCKCRCHTRCECRCCCCCQCECCNNSVRESRFDCGNRFVGFNITVTRIPGPVPPPPPPAQRLPQYPGQFIGQPQQLPPAPPTAAPARVSQPGQLPQYAPVIPVYQTWVEGRYTQAVDQSGRVTQVWIPGHYENCQMIGQ